ncbi:hypothetical protein [Sphingomonas lenta]|uniref:Uncharacterized protein n=1 Tax=Sphingomonas lenta TaxID=1141887 RepID=A0A2A2SDE8_9SPHN|nr:hypothetical protein [Sphingomonas lenta]PAX07041.1 hypothetical protein CKY28_13385 [Sphingomonas lenta]
MPDGNDAQEQQLERRYKIRQVTDYQASWTERGRGEPGKFTIQLILDKGVDEYIIEANSDDVDVILKLLKRADHAMFDMERKVLMFENLDIGD